MEGSSYKIGFSAQRIRNLKQVNRKAWWRELKSLAGFSKSNDVCLANLSYNGDGVNETELPDVVNQFLISVSDGIRALDDGLLLEMRSELGHCPSDLIVSEFEVYHALCRLNTRKASLSDGITNRLLRLLADVLATPICAVINSSIRQGLVPQQWRIARITPIPKTIPPRFVDSDLRPIAITCPISKIAEHFMSGMFNEHFDSYVDVNQFGCVAGRSTTLALIKLTHLLLDIR